MTPIQVTPTYQFRFPDGITETGTFLRRLETSGRVSLSRFSYVLDDSSILLPFHQPVPPEVTDLIDLCAAIYLVDKVAPRSIDGDARPVNERWHRRIEVELPLRCLARWNLPSVRMAVDDLLAYVSDDAWMFRFVPRVAGPRRGELLNPLQTYGEHSARRVLLHSGGLDSLFGLIDAANLESPHDVLAISVVNNGRLANVIAQVLSGLRDTVPAYIESRQLKIRLLGASRRRIDRESSQRTRGLLFLAAGVTAAVLAGTDELYVTENGPGAINLPCTLDQVGARATRAMHPKTLALLADVATRVAGRPITITNTGLFSTKGELAKGLLYGDVLPIAHQTVSCDRFPYWSASKACGTCSSCLYRRIALQTIGVDDTEADRYGERDILDPVAWRLGLDRVPLDAQRILVERLRSCLSSPEPFTALRQEFVAIDDVLAVASTVGMEERDLGSALVRLFGAQVTELDAFMAGHASAGRYHEGLHPLMAMFPSERAQAG